MTATNHALTGSLIGLVIGTTWIAVPLSILSHFVCDALPHYGAGSDTAGTKKFKKMLVFDAFGAFLVVSVLAFSQPQFWLLAAFCAFFAASPDFMWINKFLRAQRGEKEDLEPPLLLRFHARIQWFEKPSGAHFEILWAIAGIILLKLYIV